MTELNRSNLAQVSIIIFRSRGRNREETPVFPILRIAAIRNIRRLGWKNHTVDQGDAVAAKQGNLIPRGVELEIHVQAGIGGIFIGPDQQIAAGTNCRGSRIIAGYTPFRRDGQVVRQIHAAHVNRSNAEVVDLDPIVVLSLRIPDAATVGCHEFIDGQLNGCLVRVYAGDKESHQQKGTHQGFYITQHCPFCLPLRSK